MGERSGKILLGLVLLIVGALLLLDLIGIDIGDILGILIPAAIMVYGAKRVISAHSGNRFWGIFVFLFGLLMLIGKLELLFSSLVAVAIIYFGLRLLRRRSTSDSEMPGFAERQWAKSILKEDALDRWERERERKL
ncbi:hypothetical protein LOK74_01500 [Brevibacillus humidisoli]|uniref:LiaF transmembrane domain-containing protein n=1 Tax=Brevibacillus humidisoli TaxID=2895522 RepID=UPI001E567361|nr:hypothetical protein [Brevibacillus humidisoli]UFJ41255.1 hypothetical protein LOK74_01500 [Brevibacillus humidisoli]